MIVIDLFVVTLALYAVLVLGFLVGFICGYYLAPDNEGTQGCDN